MAYARKPFFVVVMVLCAVALNTLSADVTADQIMLRRKPSAEKSDVRKVEPPAVVAAPAPAAPVEAKSADVPASVQASSSAAVKASEPPKAGKPVDVSVEKAGAAANAGSPKKPKKKEAVRDAIITAERTDYDRKEGVVLFDRNVYVDDAQYQMHTDRLFLFLDGTNDLKRLVAIGNVAITNENRRAYCARATFNKKLGRIVMYSSDEITAILREEGKKESEVKGEKITFWIDSEQVEVENPVITMPGGFGGKDSLKKAIGR